MSGERQGRETQSILFGLCDPLEAFAGVSRCLWHLQLTTHGTQDMYPTFLERYRHFGPSGRAWITSVSMVGGIVGGILFGFL